MSNPDRPGGTYALAGRPVARVGYGASALARLRDDRPAAVALLRRAVELGVDHVDTAQFYGDGLVNDLLREALQPGDGVVVATKVGADPDPGGPFPMRLAQRPEQLRASVEDNLRSLGTDHVPLVNLRRLEGTSRIRAEGDQLVDLDDQLAVLTALRDAGTIGAIGLSSVEPDTVRRALPAGIACVQNEYSLVERDDDGLLDLCAAEGVAWVPFHPLGGVLAGARRVADEPAVREVAAAAGVTASQVGLAWLLHRSPAVLLIPGTASLAHLEANVAVGSLRLDPGALRALDGH
ncbi:aldo/keto reductase [Pseudonocardia sp. ICBG162]|uniref:aldo/keto reductase n=1 Tax=Pseudonocardia sp. ICBG162 TaxID=2846761 RepID=UPI001CF6E800|nr:aldo/keto reductase [Pseudonocardia sp. ICBG162]